MEGGEGKTGKQGEKIERVGEGEKKGGEEKTGKIEMTRKEDDREGREERGWGGGQYSEGKRGVQTVLHYA